MEHDVIKEATSLRLTIGPREAVAFIRNQLSSRFDLPPSKIELLRHIEAECLFDLGDYRESINVYDSIVHSEGEFIAYSNRGLAKELSGDTSGALADYLTSFTLKRDDPINLRKLGALLNRLDRYDEAIEHLHEAAVLELGSSRTFCELGIAYFNKSEWAQSYKYFQEALKLDPANELAKKGILKIEEGLDL